MKPHIAMEIGQNYPACLWHTAAVLGNKNDEEKLQVYMEENKAGSPLFHRLEADLRECQDCVATYHKAREQLAQGNIDLDAELFKLEKRRVVDMLTRPDEPIVLLALTEVLQHPFLLISREIEETFRSHLLELNDTIGLEGFLPDSVPTMYLLLIHPAQEIRELAWQCVQQPDYHINSDMYGNVSQVLAWVISVQGSSRSLGSDDDDDDFDRLPSHLHCNASRLPYWQGVSRLLAIFSKSALKQGFMMSQDLKRLASSIIELLSVYEDSDDQTQSPFWHQLQCLTSVLDKLGSSVWQNVSEDQIEDVFDMISSHPVFVTAIQTMIDGNFLDTEDALYGLPPHLSAVVAIGPTEPIKWMVPYVNSLLDFGMSASENLAEVINFLCSQLSDLLVLGKNSEDVNELNRVRSPTPQDSLIAKLMGTLLDILKSLLKTALLGNLISKIWVETLLKTVLVFLRKFPPVRAQQGVSVLVSLSNTARQFLIEVFKLASKNKSNVGQSTRYIKMLSLPQQMQLSAAANIGDLQRKKLWELHPGESEFQDFVRFVEGTLQEHSCVVPSCGESPSRSLPRRRDTFNYPVQSTSSSLSHVKNKLESEPNSGSLVSEKANRNINVPERNIFINVRAKSPKYGSKPFEDALQPTTSFKQESSPPLNTNIKQEPNSPLVIKHEIVTLDESDMSLSSSDEVIVVSDISNYGTSLKAPKTSQESSSGDVYEILSSNSPGSNTQDEQEDSQSQNEDTILGDDTVRKDPRWNPSVVLKSHSELEDCERPEGMFIVKSVKPLITRKAERGNVTLSLMNAELGWILVKKEINATDTESSLPVVNIWEDTRQCHHTPRKHKRVKHAPKKRQQFDSSDDESDTSSTGSPWGSSSETSNPVTLSPSSKLSWQGLVPQSRSWHSSPGHPRDRLSRSKKLQRIKKAPSSSSNESDYEKSVSKENTPVKTENNQPLKIKKEPVSETGVAETSQNKQSYVGLLEIKKEKEFEKEQLNLPQTPPKSSQEHSLSNNQALDYLTTSPVSDESDAGADVESVVSNDDSNMSQSLLQVPGAGVKMTLKPPSPHSQSSNESQTSVSILVSEDKFPSALSTFDSNGSGHSMPSTSSNITIKTERKSPVTVSENNTALSETPFSEEMEDVKPRICFVSPRKKPVGLGSFYSSQSLNESYSYTEEFQDSSEIIDLENYNCSELFDEDPLSQVIVLSSDEEDSNSDSNQTSNDLEIDLDIVKQEKDDSQISPTIANCSEEVPDDSQSLEDLHYLNALNDYEDNAWFDNGDDHDNDDDAANQNKNEVSFAESSDIEGDVEKETKETSKTMKELTEEDKEAKTKSHYSHLSEVEGIKDNLTEDSDDFMDEVQKAVEESLKDFYGKDATTKRKKVDSKLDTKKAQQGKIRAGKKRKIPSFEQSHSVTAVSSNRAQSISDEPTSPASKVSGSWKPSGNREPDVTPTDAEPLKRFRGKSEEPALMDTFVLDSDYTSAPKHRGTDTEEERTTATVQSWANRFGSRTSSLYEEMKKGPPSMHKSHEASAREVPALKGKRHLSGPPIPEPVISNQSNHSITSSDHAGPSYMESLPHYAQSVYAPTTITPSLGNKPSGAECKDVPQTSASGGMDFASSGHSNVQANSGQEKISDACMPSVIKPQFQFFTSDAKTAHTAASLFDRMNSDHHNLPSDTVAHRANSTALSTKTNDTPDKIPPSSLRQPLKQVISQPEMPGSRQASTMVTKESSMLPGVMCHPQGQGFKVIPSLKTVPFSEEDLFCWILGWNSQWLDIYGLETESQQPTSDLPILAECPFKTLSIVPSSFNSYDEYYRVYIPLLLHEIWAQMQCRLERDQPKMEAKFIRCTTKALRSTGNLLNCTCHVTVLGGILPITCQDVIKVSPMENTPIGWYPLLAVATSVMPVIPKPPPANDATNTNKNACENASSAEREEAVYEVSFLVLAKNEETVRVLPLTTGHNIQLKVVMSLHSWVRQFNGLISLSTGKCGLLASDILRFRRTDVYCPASRQIPPDQPGIKTLNPWQQQVVDNAVKEISQPNTLPRICLVRGLPGTGKTKLIIGLVKKLLANQKDNQHNNRLPGQQSTASSTKPGPILLCAPSDPTLNVLLKRLMSSIQTTSTHQTEHADRGAARRYRVVRVSRSNLVHESVRHYSLDMQVEAQRKQEAVPIYNEQKEKLTIKEILQRKIAENEKTCQLQPVRRDSNEQLCMLQEELRTQNCHLHKVQIQLDDLKQQQADLDTRPNSYFEQSILADADVICCTVNFSGHDLLQNASRDKDPRQRKRKFSCVIIDEANQCSELDTIIPLQCCSMKVVLVGDLRNPSAPVVSQEASQHGLNRSLFERLCRWPQLAQANPKLIHILDKQYRMHAHIAEFPAKCLCNGKLYTDKSMAKRKGFFLEPYLVFNVLQSKKTKISSRAYRNEPEAEMVVALYHRICSMKATDRVMIKEPLSVGIIVPYMEQANYLIPLIKKVDEDLSKSTPSNFKLPNREISTLEVFQGREKDIIILSCVEAMENIRLSSSPPPSFIGDWKKMNVVLTRARYSLFVVGHLSTLQQYIYYKALADDAKTRKLIIDVPGTDFSTAAKRCSKTPSCQKPGRPNQTGDKVPGAEGQQPTGQCATSASEGTSSVVLASAQGVDKNPSAQSAPSAPPAFAIALPATTCKISESTSQPPRSALKTKLQVSVNQARDHPGSSNNSSKATEAPQRGKTTSEMPRKTVSFQKVQEPERVSLTLTRSLLPKPMQKDSGILSDSKSVHNPYGMAVQPPVRNKTIKESLKLPYNGNSFKQRKKKSPRKLRQNLCQTFDLQHHQIVPRESRSFSTSLGSLSTSLGRPSTSLGGPSTSLGGPSTSLGSTASGGARSEENAGLQSSAQNRVERTSSSNSHNQPGSSLKGSRSSVLNSNGLEKHQPITSNMQPGPSNSVRERPQRDHSKDLIRNRNVSLNQSASGESSAQTALQSTDKAPLMNRSTEPDQLSKTVENLKRKYSNEKRTLPLSGLQPDPRKVRRRQKSASSGLANPDLTPALEWGKSYHRADFPDSNSE